MSQDAINASAQNAVVAINSLNKFIDTISVTLVSAAATLGDIDLKQFGSTNTSPVTQVSVSPAALTQTSSYVGSGNLVRISVIVPGTGSGFIYDKDAIGAALTDSIIAIPSTIGIYEIHMRFSKGLVVTPGYGQTVVVSYTPD